MNWKLLLLIAAVSDLLDFVGGGIPILGDILDLATTGVLYPYLGISSFIGFIELVPGVDFLPTFTLLAVWRIGREWVREGGFDDLEVPRKYGWPWRTAVF